MDDSTVAMLVASLVVRKAAKKAFSLAVQKVAQLAKK